MRDGTLKAWGYNSAGQLGDGTQQSRNLPVMVRDPADPYGSLVNIAAADGGEYHSLGCKYDGSV
jgi:alpha-tubulin suppressor-like RCC1 family protein